MTYSLADSPEWIRQNTLGSTSEARVAELLKRPGVEVRRVNAPGHDIEERVLIEVKRDSKAAQSGNLAVELSSRGKPSGLSTTTAADWIFDTGNEVIRVNVDRLRELAEAAPKLKTNDGNFVALVRVICAREAGETIERREQP